MATPTQTVAPGGQPCLVATFSQDDAHVPGALAAGGTTPDGRRVYLPVAGRQRALAGGAGVAGGELVDRLELGGDDPAADECGTLHGAAAGYAYPTDAGFLDANALFALRGAGGRVAARACGRTPPTSSTSAPDRGVASRCVGRRRRARRKHVGAMSAALVDTRCSTHSNGPRPTETTQSQHSPIVVRMNASHTSTVAS